mmetsp:Transcript_13808/g.21534  ORF Transcript_13808/g.21534 Transcript_13808/m.21534 type:complete len:114 (-) Transcript_13808:407-748(-)
MTKSCQDPPDVPSPMLYRAKRGTDSVPAVQKYSIYNRFFPRSVLGRNSAKTSKGTDAPPTPNPTANLIATKVSKFVANEVVRPKTKMMVAATQNIGRLPIRSPRCPKHKVPAS